MVPQFVSRTAQAAAPGKDNILVVLEMTGGNDGLNTVIPYADDLYHKARPTLRQTKDVVIRLDDHVGLNSGMRGFRPMWEQGQLAVVQGVGYPNPERSHFEAMDIWQSADPNGAAKTGWLGRAAAETDNHSGGVPILHLGSDRLPLGRDRGAGGGAVTVNDQNSFRLELGGGKVVSRKPAAGCSRSWRRRGKAATDDLASFVQRRQVQTLTAVETLRDLLEGPNAVPRQGGGLTQKLQLIAGLIARGFGTRIFYVSLDGFDTHAGQGPTHGNLLADLANSVSGVLPDAQDHRPRWPGAADDVLGIRPARAGKRQPRHRPWRRLVPVRGRAVGQGGRRRQAPQPGGPRRRRPEVPHRLPPASTRPCSTAGWAATARPCWAKWDHVKELEPKV